jgi:hypothetical protein
MRTCSAMAARAFGVSSAAARKRADSGFSAFQVAPLLRERFA